MKNLTFKNKTAKEIKKLAKEINGDSLTEFVQNLELEFNKVQYFGYKITNTGIQTFDCHGKSHHVNATAFNLVSKENLYSGKFNN